MHYNLKQNIKNLGYTLKDINDMKYCGGRLGQRLKYFNNFFNYEKAVLPHSNNCICGHYIVENCYIYDEKTDFIIILGNCCIRAFVKSGFKRFCSKCKKQHKNTKDNLCNNCRSDRVNKDFIIISNELDEVEESNDEEKDTIDLSKN